MSIQFMVQGFKLMTIGHKSPPITTRPGLTPLFVYLCCSAICGPFHNANTAKR